jgi:hypothetical protein
MNVLRTQSIFTQFESKVFTELPLILFLKLGFVMKENRSRLDMYPDTRYTVKKG